MSEAGKRVHVGGRWVTAADPAYDVTGLAVAEAAAKSRKGKIGFFYAPARTAS
jgi:hypothetical protein